MLLGSRVNRLALAVASGCSQPACAGKFISLYQLGAEQTQVEQLEPLSLGAQVDKSAKKQVEQVEIVGRLQVFAVGSALNKSTAQGALRGPIVNICHDCCLAAEAKLETKSQSSTSSFHLFASCALSYREKNKLGVGFAGALFSRGALFYFALSCQCCRVSRSCSRAAASHFVCFALDFALINRASPARRLRSMTKTSPGSRLIRLIEPKQMEKAKC